MTDSNNYLKVRGGRVLKGEVSAGGAKNSILPLLFASLLVEGEQEFHNVPDLKDVRLALKMLTSLGISHQREGDKLGIKNFQPTGFAPCSQSAKSFRASVLCLGPMLSSFGQVQIPLPGGCDIGARPINIHLEGLKQLGAKIDIEKGMIYGSAPQGLKGNHINLEFPSVGATENLIMACVKAQGESHLTNLACEPEIKDLISYLKSAGACIEQTGDRELKIKGTSRLKAKNQAYRVIPDRIETGTLLLAGACSQGEVLVKECEPLHLQALLEKLKQAGFIVSAKENSVFLKSEKNPKALNIKTGVYPAFPTDLQSQFMALMTQLEGSSSLEETIFERRFRYVEQLNLLGAGIQIQDNRKAFVKGPVVLKAHKMTAGDLRAGAGLILASLTAQGESHVYGLHHIERGYENLFLKLKSLNADVELIQDLE